MNFATFLSEILIVKIVDTKFKLIDPVCLITCWVFFRKIYDVIQLLFVLFAVI